MPLGKYKNFAACVAGKRKEGLSLPASKRYCGALQQRIEGNRKPSSSKLKGASAINQMSTALVKDRRDNIDNTNPEETSESVQVPVPAMQVIGNFVINAMKLFEQAEGVPDELVQLGNQAQSALQSISAPD